MSKSNSELLRELRELTAAGMKDCKDALEEANWDLSKAVDIVKTKGLQNVSRTAGKVAAEGRVVADLNASASKGTLIEVNCQTDFVAKNPDFIAFAAIAGCVLGSMDLHNFSGDLSKAELMIDNKVDNLENVRKEIIASTKENVVVRRWLSLDVQGDNRKVFQYTHSNHKLAVLVAMEAPDYFAVSSPDFKELADNVAMQIAAMNPLAVSRDKVPETEVERQKAIFETQLKELNKPEAAWPKIMEGKFNKWFTEVCLLDQEAVFATKTSVSTAMDNVSKQLCGEAGKIKVLNFVRCQVGEGIEVEKTDLAAEVEKLSGVAQRS